MGRASSFENDLLKAIPNSTYVQVLHPSPCVRGWIMHMLSETYAVNGLAWTQESLMLK